MRKNVAGQNIAAQMNSRTDGSPLTTAVSVLVTVDNGTQTAGGGTATHKGNGHWNYAPTQAETNGNHIAFTFTHASGVHQTVNVYTVSFDPHDTAGLGLSRLDAAVSTRAIPGDLMGLVAGAITSAKFAAGAIDAAAIATDAIGAAEFAQTAADKIWTSATRSLTDKAGFALAAAEYAALVNLLWDELAAEVRVAGSYGQLLKDNLNAAVGSRAVAGDAMTLTAGERDAVANALLDLANAIETALTVRGALRVALATLAGKASGLPTAPVYRNVGDSKNRVTATTDADGNRTAVTVDAT